MPVSEELEQVARCALCGHAGSRVWREAACPEAPDEVFTTVECGGCGLRYLNPRPRPEAMGRYYGADYYSYEFHSIRPRSHRLKCRLWRALRLLPPPARPGLFQRLIRRIAGGLWGVRTHWLLPAPQSGLRFLDIGCGAGHRLELARDLGWETCGVDLGVGGLPAAREHGHHVAAADAAALPFAPESFDYVNLAHTLEHTRDPVAVLAECRRVLSPAGVIQIVVPNSASWGSRHFGSQWRALEPPRHLYQFAPATLAACARQAGLAVRAVSTLHNEWVLQESRRLAGEKAPPPVLEALRRRGRLWTGQGENLCLWCARP